MPGLNTAAKNAMLDANPDVWPPDRLSLHSGDPGSGATPTAGTELSGGAYTRGTVGWGGADGARRTATSLPTIKVPEKSTVAFMGYWRGTTFLGSRALETPESFNGPGEYTPEDVYEELI